MDPCTDHSDASWCPDEQLLHSIYTFPHFPPSHSQGIEHISAVIDMLRHFTSSHELQKAQWFDVSDAVNMLCLLGCEMSAAFLVSSAHTQ